MYLSDQHRRLASPILNSIKDIEHFRSRVDLVTELDNGRMYCHWGRPKHTAVIVFKDGSCYVGQAICSEKDTYNRKVGYNISVGRALKAWHSGQKPDFTVDPATSGMSLRDVCRSYIERYAGG